MDLKTFIDSVKKLNGKRIDIDRWNEDIQLAIVKNTSNQLLLAYFVNNSEYKYVHYMALDKIDDEDILMDIALNNTHLYWGDYGFMTVSSYLDPAYYNSEKAFSKINDSCKLIEIAKSTNHKLYNLRHMAKFIDDDEVWADIAVDANLAYHKIFALKRISSKKTFVGALVKCDIEKISSEANYIQDNSFVELLDTITEEDYLKSIVSTGSDDEGFWKDVFLTYKNRDVRALAIEQISDNDFLKEIAHDEDSLFRLNAVKNIHDESFLKSVASDDEDLKVRRHALENIRDESFLKSVVLDDADSNIREYALENIHDEGFLKSFIRDEEVWFVQASALENIHDESFLKSVFLDDDFSEAREYALKNIHDECFLKEVVLNDEELYVRRHALKNIHDSNILKSCVSHGKGEFEEIIDRIDDEDFLKGIVRDCETYDENERFYALKNISDIDFLREIALNDFAPVCQYASLMTGEYDIIKQKTYDDFPKELLYEVLHDNINNEIAIELMKYVDRYNATPFIEEMTDDGIFLAVLNKRRPRIAFDCNTTVFNNRLRKVSDEDSLKDIFINGKDEDLRRWAASKVDDEDFFRDTFFKSDESWLKAAALENIHDQDLLRDIVLNGEDCLLKSSALVNIVDEDFLKSIYFNADSDDQKNIIISKTDDVDICTDYSFSGNDSDLRMKACRKITDENILKDLFFKEPSRWVRDVFSQNIHDDEFFMEILHGEYDDEIRYSALRAIENNENLVEVAHDFSNHDLSKRAIDLIKDDSALRSICERTPTSCDDEKIIEYARKHLYNLFFKSKAQLYMHG